MTRKRRYLISAAVFFVACVCIALGLLAMLPPRAGVTKANFDRIEIGMRRAQVELIVGETEWISERPGDISQIHANGMEIAIRIVDDEVVDKRFFQITETFPDKLRRWLYLPK